MNEEYADIQNRIYEAGILRPGEKVVLVMEDCVLLEHFIGKVYNYRMVELRSFKVKRLFSRQAPLTENGYGKAVEKMLSLASKAETPQIQDRHTRAVVLLVHIFSNILPKHGLILRKNQLSLSLAMLESMEKVKVALCEAEVGTGKTYAYLLAAVVYRLFWRNEKEGFSERQSIIISTSTLALQKALTDEYIPQISDILLEHRIINTKLTFVVRKGKAHYACDSRVKTYLASIKHNNRPEDRELIGILTDIFSGARSMDLDGLPLSDYVKERICVERCQRTCEFATVCRYRGFIKKAGQNGIDFQIANHNLVLADVLSRKDGRDRLLPEHCVLIFDEAHKLLDAARQMYGTVFEDVELERLASGVRRGVGGHLGKGNIILLCEEMLEWNRLFFEIVRKSIGQAYGSSCAEVVFTPEIMKAAKTLGAVLEKLSMCFYTVDNRNAAYKKIFSRINREQEKLRALLDDVECIYWLESMGVTACRLCSLPKELDFLLFEDIWSQGKPCVLTSATLSVGGDFSHFMHQMGIDMLAQNRLLTVSKASPFDYRNHALLYLPDDMPFPKVKNRAYVDAVLGRLRELIGQTYGHTLVLFTSYRMMEVCNQELVDKGINYPLFSMGKGRLDAIKEFRKSGNGVLLASDSAGEGIDLAGDVLSSLVVVKLPFPTPDPILEYEKSLYDDFYGYLSEVIVPNMLMKLRQWIGRGIRRETDTCVFSILDSRASGRYRKDILSALPDMPVTDQVEDVGRFIAANKGEEYFKEGQ